MDPFNFDMEAFQQQLAAYQPSQASNSGYLAPPPAAPTPAPVTQALAPATKGPGVSFDQYLASGAFQPRWNQTWDGMRDLAKQIGYTGIVNDPASHQESGYYQDVMGENSTVPMWTSASSGTRGNWVGDEYGSTPRFVPDTTSPYETRTVKDLDTLNPDFQKAVNAKNYNFTHIPVGGNSNMGVYDGGTQIGRYNASSYENNRFEQFVQLALSAAGAAAGPIGSAIVNGATTGMQGGDIGDILTSAAKSYAINTAGATAAPYISNAAGSVGSAVGSELGSTAGDIARGAVSRGASSAIGAGLSGGNILDAALQGAVSGGISSGVNSTVGQFTSGLPAPIAAGLGSGAVALITGKDPLRAVTSAVLGSAFRGIGSNVPREFGGKTPVSATSEDPNNTTTRYDDGSFIDTTDGVSTAYDSDGQIYTPGSNPGLSSNYGGYYPADEQTEVRTPYTGYTAEPVQQVEVTAPRQEPYYPADEQTEVNDPSIDYTSPAQQVEIIGAKPSTPGIISTPPTGQPATPGAPTATGGSPATGSKTPAKGSNSGIDMNSLLAMMMLMNKDDQQPQTPYHLADVRAGVEQGTNILKQMYS